MAKQEPDEIRCPAGARWSGDRPGCGSPNVIKDPTDNLWDCIDCGLWFDPDEPDEPRISWPPAN